MSEAGHWVTLEDGRHVFIEDPIGRRQAAVDLSKLPPGSSVHVVHIAAREKTDFFLSQDRPESIQHVVELSERPTAEQEQYLRSLGYSTYGSVRKHWNGEVVPVKKKGSGVKMSTDSSEKPVGLFLSGSSTPPRELPLALDSRYPKQVGGVDAFYNRKDVISTGLRTHPDTGLQFGVTPERMDKWVRNFRLMRERGVRVFLPNKHKKFDATDNNGWVLDLQREGDTLYSVEQLIGEDAKRNAARNDRSVYVQPNFKDDAGNDYDEAIVHVALCPNPVVSGLSEPVPLAASRNGPVMEALVLSLAEPIRSPTMDISKLREALGAAKDIPDEQVIQQVTTKLAAVPALETDKATALSRVTAVEAERDAAKAQVLELSRTGFKQPDADLAIERQKRLASEADAAVAQGKLAPFLADTFKGWLAKENQFRPLMLSRDTDADECVAEKLLPKLIEASPKIQFGGQTGAQQTLVLGRQAYGNAGDAGADDKPITPERLKEILSLTPLGNDILATAAAK